MIFLNVIPDTEEGDTYFFFKLPIESTNSLIAKYQSSGVQMGTARARKRSNPNTKPLLKTAAAIFNSKQFNALTVMTHYVHRMQCESSFVQNYENNNLGG